MRCLPSTCYETGWFSFSFLTIKAKSRTMCVCVCVCVCMCACSNKTEKIKVWWLAAVAYLVVLASSPEVLEPPISPQSLAGLWCPSHAGSVSWHLYPVYKTKGPFRELLWEFLHTPTLPFFKSKHNIFNVHIKTQFIVKTASFSRLLTWNIAGHMMMREDK